MMKIEERNGNLGENKNKDGIGKREKRKEKNGNRKG